jgi:RNA polymerase sigma factor (sigma-70 family)
VRAANVARSVSGRRGYEEATTAMTASTDVSKRMAGLVRRVADARDREAFAQLFDHYAPRLAAYLQKLGAEPALAEEIAQDAMVALWRKADQFDASKSSVGTWLYRIARNRRIDLLRRARGGEVELGEAEQPVDDAPRPDEQLAAHQRETLVRRAMRALPAEQLALVRLAFFEGRSHSEIASETGLPLGTVKSRIRLAFSRLRRGLEADGLVDAN